ncbi:MAG: siroheme synthase CysG [Alphaproteobacteria bacterium]
MDYFPIFLDMQGRTALVVGGTEAAAQKARLLLRAGATLRIVAGLVGAEMRAVFGEPLVTVEHRAFQPADLDGVSLVVASSDDEEENRLVSNAAQARGLPVNVVDRTDLCSFIMPAFVDRSPILVAVSSGGTSPVLARLVRAKIEAVLPQALGKLAALAQAFRQQVMRRLAAAARRRFWEDVLEGEIAERVFANDIPAATARLQAKLDAEARSGKSTPVPVAPWLVGAGPGDPDLLTAKALRLMQRCDVVLYDRLVAPAILDRVRRDAEFIAVGKMPGGAGWSQERINALMIERAMLGQRVLRLQGGDPTIFGRAGEEIDALRAAGIEPLVVPGVTAASATAAELGVSLTDRRSARSLVFTNGPALLDTAPAAPRRPARRRRDHRRLPWRGPGLAQSKPSAGCGLCAGHTGSW